MSRITHLEALRSGRPAAGTQSTTNRPGSRVTPKAATALPRGAKAAKAVTGSNPPVCRPHPPLSQPRRGRRATPHQVEQAGKGPAARVPGRDSPRTPAAPRDGRGPWLSRPGGEGNREPDAQAPPPWRRQFSEQRRRSSWPRRPRARRGRAPRTWHPPIPAARRGRARFSIRARRAA